MQHNPRQAAVDRPVPSQSKLYVWEASLEIQWEPGYPLGLYFKKSDAKKACEEEAAKSGQTLKWDNSDRNHSTCFYGKYSNDFYSVARREVK